MTIDLFINPQQEMPMSLWNVAPALINQEGIFVYA
jgi:hypothetical protein